MNITLRKKAYKKIRIATSAAACLCIAVLTVFGIQQSNITNEISPAPAGSYIDVNRSTDDTNDVNGKQNDDDTYHNAIKLLFKVNNITSVSKTARRCFDPDLYYTEIWDRNKTTNYFGIDLTGLGKELIMPAGFKYSGDGKNKITFQKNGKISDDLCSFSYSSTNGKQKIKISASKTGSPFDCVYTLADNEHPYTNFRFNGINIPILFGGKSTSEEPLNNDYDLLFADFQCKGVSYRITAENFPAYEFYKIAEGIIKLS